MSRYNALVEADEENFTGLNDKNAVHDSEDLNFGNYDVPTSSTSSAPVANVTKSDSETPRKRKTLDTEMYC